MEAVSVKDLKMLNTIEYGFSIFLCSVHFSLVVLQKLDQVLQGHSAIFRVLVKEVLHVFWGISPPKFKPSPETEAHLERVVWFTTFWIIHDQNQSNLASTVISPTYNLIYDGLSNLLYTKIWIYR